MKKLDLVRTIILAGSLLLQLSPLCFHLHGAPGDVDLSFDPGSGVNDQVTALALQPDGKVIIGGWFTAVKGLPRRDIARLNADGSGDSSFNPAALPGGVFCLVLQADGKVLVGNYSGVFRLNADGSLDPTFSATMDVVDGYEVVYSIAVQSDGKVLIGGNFTTINGAERNGIARLNANGTLDSGFNPGLGTFPVYAIAVQPDGKVLIAGGFQSVNGTNRNHVTRLEANGSLDGSFNPGTGPNSSWVASLALQADGKIVIGGGFTAMNGTNCNGVARLNANGSLDGSFSPGTVLTANYLTDYFAVNSLAVQGDGKVIVGGTFAVNVTNSINLARLNADGSLDGGFSLSKGADSDVLAVAVQPDGRVLLGGAFTGIRGTIRNYIAALNAAGSLDVSFDPGEEISNQVRSVVVQPDGKVLLGGSFDSVQGTNRNGIARLNANGSLDRTFDPGTGVNGAVHAIALQADGKVLLGGSFNSVNGTNCNCVARLNTNGSLDYGFHPDLTPLNPGNGCPPWYTCDPAFPEATDILVQPDGKVLIGGAYITVVWPMYAGEDTQYIHRYFLGRFNADGSRDNSFLPATNFPASYMSVYSFALQPDGKVLIGGSLLFNETNYILARLNADGSYDSSFNSVPGYVGVSSIALQSDGKVIIGGGFSTVHGASRNQVARLQANGNLDRSFNPGATLNGELRSVASQPDGKVLTGGTFYNLNGTNIYDYYTYGIARRNADGSLDSSFNPGTFGGWYSAGTYYAGVYSMALQPDGNILIGGSFPTVNGAMRPQVARLYGDAVAPSLSITRSNAFVIVSWPAGASGFQLQENTNLLLPNSWSPVAQSTITNAGQISVTVPASVGSQLFRLKSP